MSSVEDKLGLVLCAIGVVIILAGGSLGGLLLGLPFIAGGLVVNQSVNTKLCPQCSERVKKTAMKCKHCGSDLAALP